MYTVGMFMPSVKLYQPKPNGQQLHIISQASIERNLHKIRDELISYPELFTK